MCAQPAKRRFALLLAYQGGAFHGWQMQTDRSSVQETVGQAMLAAGLPPNVNGASRTDRGVHARAMVASTTFRSEIATHQLLAELRAHLPPTVRLRAAREVGEDFHAQFSSAEKTYRYRIFLPADQESQQPLGGPCAWTLFTRELRIGAPKPFSMCKLLEALGAMRGRRSFAGVLGANAKEGLCDLTEARLHRQVLRAPGAWLTLSFRADRFGKYMIRTLVGVAVRCALGELDPLRLAQQLDSGLNLGQLVAPPEGLILWKVHYPRASRTPTGDPFPWLSGS